MNFPSNQSIRDREENLRSAALKWQEQAIKDQEFAAGNQWTAKEKRDLKKNSQFAIVVNIIAPTVEQGVAMLTNKRPRFSATAREDSDTSTARVFADLMEYVWDISNGNQEFKVAVNDYYIMGLGYLMAYIDPYADFGKGEVFIKSLNPLNVLIDPHSKRKDFQDASEMQIIQYLTKKEIQYLYPDFQFDQDVEESGGNEYVGSSQQNGLNITRPNEDSNYEAKYKIIDSYRKVKLSYYRVFDPKTANEKIFNSESYTKYLQKVTFVAVGTKNKKYIYDDQEILRTKQLINQFGDEFHEELNPQIQQPQTVKGPEDGKNPLNISGSGVKIIASNIDEFIGEGILRVAKVPINRISRELYIGYKLYYEGIVETDIYPIIPFVNRHFRNPYPISDVRMTRDLQRYINKIRSLIVAHASNSTNVKLLLPRGGVDKRDLEREWAKAGTGIIEFDAEIGQPIIAAPTPLPNELYKNEADARRDIQFEFGIFDLMHGDPSNAPDTYKGTVAIDEMGQRRIKSKRDDIETALNLLGKLVVNLMQSVYTYEKTVRILRPNNESTTTTINQPIYDDITGKFLGKTNDITVGKYDIIMVSGSTLPSNRWARSEYYLQLYKEGIIDQVEVLKQTEVADMEGVLQRFSMISKLQQQLQAAQQEIKKLSGDLQTADREAVHANKKVELEKFKTKLNKSSTGVSAATDLYKQRLKDELSKTKNQLTPLQ